jgi:hypothetical protein
VTTGHLPEIDTKSLRVDLVNELQSGASFGRIGPVGPDHQCGAYGPPPMRPLQYQSRRIVAALTNKSMEAMQTMKRKVMETRRQIILNGHELVPEPDFMRWSELFEHADRTNTVRPRSQLLLVLPLLSDHSMP